MWSHLSVRPLSSDTESKLLGGREGRKKVGFRVVPNYMALFCARSDPKCAIFI